MPAMRQNPAKLLKAGILGGPAEGQAATWGFIPFWGLIFPAVLKHAYALCR